MWMRKSASLIFAAAVGSVIGLMVFSKKQPSPAHAQPEAAPTTRTTTPSQPVVPVAGAPTSFVELVKHARTSVVNIHSTLLIKQRPVAVFPFGEDSPFYRLVQPPDEHAASLGSGVIISADGDILTN